MDNILEIFDLISEGCSDRFNMTKLNNELLPKLYITLSRREGLMPLTEMTYTVHQLVHVFQDIKHTGPPRFIWMYAFERVNKYCKNLIKNQREPLNSMVKNYIWVETLTIFLLFRMENLENILQYTQNIDKDYIDKHIISFKDIYIEKNNGKYMIHSMQSSRFIQLSGYECLYELDDEDKEYLLLAASAKAKAQSLLHQLYVYWNNLRQKHNKRFRVNDYCKWLHDLPDIPIEVNRRIRNKQLMNSDWQIIKNEFPNQIKIRKEALIGGSYFTSIYWDKKRHRFEKNMRIISLKHNLSRSFHCKPQSFIRISTDDDVPVFGRAMSFFRFSYTSGLTLHPFAHVDFIKCNSRYHDISSTAQCTFVNIHLNSWERDHIDYNDCELLSPFVSTYSITQSNITVTNSYWSTPNDTMKNVSFQCTDIQRVWPVSQDGSLFDVANFDIAANDETNNNDDEESVLTALNRGGIPKMVKDFILENRK